MCVTKEYNTVSSIAEYLVPGRRLLHAPNAQLNVLYEWFSVPKGQLNALYEWLTALNRQLNALDEK